MINTNLCKHSACKECLLRVKNCPYCKIGFTKDDLVADGLMYSNFENLVIICDCNIKIRYNSFR